MTPLPRSRSPPPPHSLFLFRPRCPPSRGLRRPTGDTPVKLHSGGAARLPGYGRAGGVSRLGSHRLTHRSAARRAPVGYQGLPRVPPWPPGLAGRRSPRSRSPRLPAAPPPAPSRGPRARWVSAAAASFLPSGRLPSGLCRLFSQT